QVVGLERDDRIVGRRGELVVRRRTEHDVVVVHLVDHRVNLREPTRGHGDPTDGYGLEQLDAVAASQDLETSLSTSANASISTSTSTSLVVQRGLPRSCRLRIAIGVIHPFVHLIGDT